MRAVAGAHAFQIGPDHGAEFLTPGPEDDRVEQDGRPAIGRGDVDADVRAAGEQGDGEFGKLRQP